MFPSIHIDTQLIFDFSVTILGTGPRFLAEIQGKGIDPRELMINTMASRYSYITNDALVKLASFETLRTIMSTGSVLTAPMFEWTQETFGPNVHINSVSGGTDICAGCKWTESVQEY